MSTASRYASRLRVRSLADVSDQAWAVAALAVVFAVAAVIIYNKSKGVTFYQDEWDFALKRRDWSLDTLLRPHNDHLSLVPVLAYKLLFETVGLDSYRAYMPMIIAANLLCGGLLFAYARRRVGVWPAAALAAILVTLGPAWHDIIWAFQVGYLGSIAAGLGMLLALERGDRSGDLWAGGLLLVSIAFSGLGIPFGIAAVVRILLEPERWRRLVRVVALPFALYLVWYLVYQDDIQAYRERIGRDPLLTVPALLEIPRFAARGLAGALAALTGLELEWGRALAVALAGLVCWHVARARELPARFWSVLVLAGAFFGLTALGRVGVDAPEASRYIYPGVVAASLVVVEIAARWPITARASAVVGVVAALAVVSNLGDLREAQQIQRISDYVAPKLMVVEIARDHVDPAFKPEPKREPVIVAGEYLAAVDALGSPADTPDDLDTRPEQARSEADAVLAGLVGFRVEPLPGKPRGTGSPPPIDAEDRGRATTTGPCHAFGGGGARALEVTVPGGGLELEAPAGTAIHITLRRFSDRYLPASPQTDVAAGSAGRLVIPRDRSSRPWHARLAADAPFTACSGGAG